MPLKCYVVWHHSKQIWCISTITLHRATALVAFSHAGVQLKASFAVSDALGTADLNDRDGPFDVVTCMFAIHYFFSSEKTAQQFLRNVSHNLLPGVTHEQTPIAADLGHAATLPANASARCAAFSKSLAGLSGTVLLAQQ